MEIQQEQQVAEAVIKPRVFSTTQIRFGTFLGGPIVAGYYFAENYKAFGDKGRARASWIYGIAATIIIAGGIVAIPADVKIPNYIFPLAYGWTAYYMADHFQGSQIIVYTAGGEGLFGWGRVILVAFIGVAITFLCLYLAVIIADR
ncbi:MULTISPECIES: hypothetical protein [unclassified Mucilaginibacter]|uniref:hypothetical protein n=1 Tax=unclassified Mucilaginibacter TaxID=2617802 RepID=UPI0033921EF3